MNISIFFKNLNEQQKKAVFSKKSKCLVLAGAGSGKTSVLVYRIAWLILEEKYSASSIIAVTFTNKAAKEMKNRIEQLIPSKKRLGMWIGTFHSLSHRILRKNYKYASLSKDFQIIDEEDQIRLIKRILNLRNLSQKIWLPKNIMWRINKNKELGIRPNFFQDFNKNEYIFRLIYEDYQKICNQSGLVDFSELLLRTYELWENNEYLRKYYCERFTNIMIDEFQDTSSLQYKWIRKLVRNNNNIMIVGDDDQSIYSWRGAKVENIKKFLHDFPNAKLMRLEQNYRSTSSILEAANILISHNSNRIGKNLWTEKEFGEPIKFYQAIDEIDEANFIANCIKINKEKKNIKLKECAVLYRSNIQSRIIEEILLKMGLPYHVYGGTSFFERKEIKDVLAYLRLIINKYDDIAFERIINLPARTIGKNTLNKIHKVAKERNLTLWESSKFILLNISNLIPKNSFFALKKFINLIKSLRKEILYLPLYLKVDYVLKKTGIWNMYKQEKERYGQYRIENLKELVNAAHQFDFENKKGKYFSSLKKFLSHTSLERNSFEEKEEINGKIQLMTLHASKGLEFPQVFITGMEEGIFPSYMSLKKISLLEEERRLAYVGITRAMKNLTLTYSKTRRIYGKEKYNYPSRFIKEFYNYLQKT